jgi:hypothetical protein
VERVVSIIFLMTIITLVGAAQPAWACRCWVGNSDTTDEDRLRAAKETVSRADIAVIGRIEAIESLAEDRPYTHRDGAIIAVEKVLTGKPAAEIVLSKDAGEGVYDGYISHNLMGTCGMSWSDGERNVWLLLLDKNGNYVLASSCAHSLVREWLYPEFVSEPSE